MFNLRVRNLDCLNVYSYVPALTLNVTMDSVEDFDSQSSNRVEWWKYYNSAADFCNGSNEKDESPKESPCDGKHTLPINWMMFRLKN